MAQCEWWQLSVSHEQAVIAVRDEERGALCPQHLRAHILDVTAGAFQRAAPAMARRGLRSGPARQRTSTKRWRTCASKRENSRPGDGGGRCGWHVPSDIFCSTSPEQKAGERLSLLLTQEAIKTIVEQGMGQRYRSDISKDLSAYVLSHPLNNDPKDWLLTMLSNDSYYRQTAMRIMEVREHIASDTFKWKDLPERLLSEVHEDNSELLTHHIASGLEKQLEQTVDEDEESTGE